MQPTDTTFYLPGRFSEQGGRQPFKKSILLQGQRFQWLKNPHEKIRFPGNPTQQDLAHEAVNMYEIRMVFSRKQVDEAKGVVDEPKARTCDP